MSDTYDLKPSEHDLDDESLFDNTDDPLTLRADLDE